MHPSNNVVWGVFALYVASVIAVSFVVRFGSVQQRALWATIFLAVAGGFANVIFPSARFAAYGAAFVGTVGIGVWAWLDRRSDATRWIARAGNAVVLQPPFSGRWRVAAGGPDPRHNHHQVASDQYFAYDFLNDEGPSWDQPILAPCRGMIAHVEDRHEDAEPNARRRERKHPFGNYVSIETPRGYVILAHLKRGSICVRPGAPVVSGEEIARCGNSGNTTQSHLHVHAQKTAFADPGVAEGLPIAFVSDSGEPLLLEFGDTLTRGTPSSS